MRLPVTFVVGGAAILTRTAALESAMCDAAFDPCPFDGLRNGRHRGRDGASSPGALRLLGRVVELDRHLTRVLEEDLVQAEIRHSALPEVTPCRASR